MNYFQSSATIESLWMSTTFLGAIQKAYLIIVSHISHGVSVKNFM